MAGEGWGQREDSHLPRSGRSTQRRQRGLRGTQSGEGSEGGAGGRWSGDYDTAIKTNGSVERKWKHRKKEGMRGRERNENETNSQGKKNQVDDSLTTECGSTINGRSGCVYLRRSIGAALWRIADRGVGVLHPILDAGSSLHFYVGDGEDALAVGA